MKKQSTLLLSAITCCVSLAFAPYASSQNPLNPFPFPGSGNESGWHGGYNPYPVFHLPRLKRYTNCPQCQSIAAQYNRTLDAALDSGDYLDDIEDDIDDDIDDMDDIDATVSYLEMVTANSASRRVNRNLAQAKERQQFIHDRYKSDVADFDEEMVNYRKLNAELDQLTTDLNTCEETYCKYHYSTPTHFMGYQGTIDIGLMLGNTNTSRTVRVDTPWDLFSSSNSQNNFEAGLQAKFLFGNPEKIRPFVYVNGGSTFNSSNQLFQMPTFPGSDINTTFKISSNWVGRLGVGVESKPFNNFSFNGGLGAALINQNVTATITELNMSKSSTSKTAFAPSAMLGISYNLCPTCISGHPLILSAQLTADKYPNINLSTMALPSRNNYNFTTDSKWQLHEAFVLSTRF